MFSGSESTNSWTKGMRRPYAVVAELTRFLVGVWMALTLVFVTLRVWSQPAFSITPHNPQYAGFISQNAATFALDQPLSIQYVVWFLNVLIGRLGISYYYRTPVMDLIATRLPVTLELLTATTLWAVLLGIVLGFVAANRRIRIARGVARGAALFLYALPLFWLVLVVLLGVYESWKVSPGLPFTSPNEPPRVTGFLILDALLSGNLGDAWLAVWTTALLALPAGMVLCLPIAMRVRNALAGAAQSNGVPNPVPGPTPSRPRSLGTVLAAVTGGIGVLMPFLVSAVSLEEWIGDRRGVAWLAITGIYRLDTTLIQGTLAFLALVALAAALPFALLGAGFLHRPRPVSTRPRAVPGSTAFNRWTMVVARRLMSRSSLVFWIGLILVAVPLVMTAAAPLLSPYGPMQRVTDTACSTMTPPLSALQPPCPAHPLGTDYFSFDIYSQVLYGGGYLMVSTLEALAVSASIAVALALLCALVGRFTDVPLRVVLGALATFPVLLLVFLFFATDVPSPLVTALELVFLPVLFRDARDLVAPVERPRPLQPSGAGSFMGLLYRALASVGAIGPGFAARLPRRLAEMGLLFETVGFIGLIPPNQTDWASMTGEAIQMNASAFNLPWLVVPGLVFFLYTFGLLVLSDSLRVVLNPEDRGPAPAPLPAPPTPAAPPIAPEVP